METQSPKTHSPPEAPSSHTNSPPEAHSSPETHSPDTQSLYDRLGGAEGIDTLVEEIVEAHMENPTISARFLPYAAEPERLAELKEHLRRFLAAGSGGPDHYEGRSMPEAHHGLNISVDEYMAAVDDIMAVLDRNDISESACKDVLAITYALKSEIVLR